MNDRLDKLRSYDTDTVRNYLNTRESCTIPPDMQRYILYLNSAASIIHHNGTNLTRILFRQIGHLNVMLM